MRAALKAGALKEETQLRFSERKRKREKTCATLACEREAWIRRTGNDQGGSRGTSP